MNLTINNQPLAKPQRTLLENTVKSARDVAEKGAYAALAQLAVSEASAPSYLTDDLKALRRRLRAHGRALGDKKASDDTQALQHLAWEVAYEHWHRMLFARFLAENGLLLWEPGASVSLDDCRDMVDNHPDMAMGAKSHWELAGKLAARMLPQVFKQQSPVFELAFAPEHQRELERLLAALPSEVFQASDSLGWVYQFWQAKRKDEVNASEVKIGADELPAVTQLFTEPYMVDFLLHNSLGAWWVTRHAGKTCPVPLTYLRTLEDGTPAAGKFEGWPDRLQDFKLLDPCCGSGHFLVAAFLLLVPMRMAAEGTSAGATVDAVLGQNLHGLELDARCVEIAVFALALAAWRFPDENGDALGVRADMPAPQIACCGLKVAAKPEDWMALVPDDAPHAAYLRQELCLLHASFAQAPLLGSLLDPARSLKNDLATSSFDTLRDLLGRALASERPATLWGLASELQDDSWDLALTAKGLLDAARLLDGRYHLVITNVPYLARGNHSAELKSFIDMYYRDARADLATVFIERCMCLCANNAHSAIVSPQNWWFLGSYSSFRKELLAHNTLEVIVALGEDSWESFGNRGPLATLVIMRNLGMDVGHRLSAMDMSKLPGIDSKKNGLETIAPRRLMQSGLIANPDSRILFEEIDTKSLLQSFARTHVGFQNGDSPRFLRFHFELDTTSLADWRFIQMPPNSTGFAVGLDTCISAAFEGEVRHASSWHAQSSESFGRPGVLVRNMRDLTCTPYLGGYFDQSATAITCDRELLPALWKFLTSSEYQVAVRQLDSAVKVTPATLGKVPFPKEHWERKAQLEGEGADSNLRPYTDDPSSWCFHGHPQPATDPLQVAVARLVGYRWPAETDAAMEMADEARNWITHCEVLSEHTDDDGIVCLSSVRGEQAAHDRLLKLLIAAWETVQPGSWKPAILDKLLADADCAGKGLDVWLRDKFFEQHCQTASSTGPLFGISGTVSKTVSAVLVNYHQFDNAKNLERLISHLPGRLDSRHQQAGLAQ
jgi:hypothetical protein